MQRPARARIPRDDAFTLVGDAEPGDPSEVDEGIACDLIDERADIAADLVGIMSDPARRGVMLRVGLFCLVEDHPLRIHQGDERPGRALVDSDDKFMLGSGQVYIQ